MTIASDLTPIQAKLIRLCLQFDDAGNLVTSDAEIDVYNADGRKLLRTTVNVPWTAGEQSAIEANIADKWSTFLSINGFTVYEGG